MPSLFSINPKAVGRRLLLKKVQHAIDDFFGGLGDERLLLLVRRNLDLKEAIPPKVLDKYAVEAQKYRWLREVIQKEDIQKMIGSGRLSLIKGEAGGEEWLGRQIDFLMNLFV